MLKKTKKKRSQKDALDYEKSALRVGKCPKCASVVLPLEPGICLNGKTYRCTSIKCKKEWFLADKDNLLGQTGGNDGRDVC